MDNNQYLLFSLRENPLISRYTLFIYPLIVMKVEICCGHLESARTAVNAGADRLELCRALPLGGLTPSPSFIRHIKAESNTPLMVLIRPREGHFHYTSAERLQYLRDIEISINAGADGLVVGVLTADNQIDLPFLKEIITLTDGLPITFHRAFDFVTDPLIALQQLMDLGIDRLLTSGQQATAWQGRKLVKELIDTAQNRTIIMPGSGIHADKIQELTSYCGNKEIHLSAKKICRHTKEQDPFDIDYWTADESIIKQIRDGLVNLRAGPAD